MCGRGARARARQVARPTCACTSCAPLRTLRPSSAGTLPLSMRSLPCSPLAIESRRIYSGQQRGKQLLPRMSEPSGMEAPCRKHKSSLRKRCICICFSAYAPRVVQIKAVRLVHVLAVLLKFPPRAQSRCHTSRSGSAQSARRRRPCSTAACPGKASASLRVKFLAHLRHPRGGCRFCSGTCTQLLSAGRFCKRHDHMQDAQCRSRGPASCTTRILSAVQTSGLSPQKVDRDLS